MLAALYETPNGLEAAQAAMVNHEVNMRWQSLMASFFELPEGARPDQMLIELEEVFHLD